MNKPLQNERKECYCRDCNGKTLGTRQCDPCHANTVKAWAKEAETKYNLRPFKKEKAGQVGKTVV